MLATARPRFGAEGQFQGYIGMAMDLTTIKAAEARQRLLINELNHRVKNTLSSVQSIARQTLRTDETPAHVRERFIDRLLAMSAAHDVLTRENWEGAAIDEIARQALRPFVDDRDAGRIRLDLPSLKVDPIAALALAMALHELATNAVKYGALSNLEGRVTIDWIPSESDRTIVRWRESGGPSVSPPQRRGFGSRLLEGGLTADLGGQPRLSFEIAGVVGLLPLRLVVP
jgi:two-component sensor histidine kinase